MVQIRTICTNLLIETILRATVKLEQLIKKQFIVIFRENTDVLILFYYKGTSLYYSQ